MKPTIAFVHELARILSIPLEAENMIVRQYTNGADAYDALVETPAHLGIFKRHLPGMYGSELFRRIRKTSAMPVIFLTTRGAAFADDCSGADDYLMTGCSPHQLTDSVKHTLSMHYPGQFALSPLSSKPLVIDRNRRTCHWRGQRVFLNMPELLMLEALAGGGIQTRFALMQAAYGPRVEMDQEIVDGHLASLAHKFRQIDGTARIFERTCGVGFTLTRGVLARNWA